MCYVPNVRFKKPNKEMKEGILNDINIRKVSGEVHE